MIGDRIPYELTAPTVLSNSATAIYTNTASYRTQALEIWMANTSASSRTVTLYKNGTAVGNQIANSITLAANTSTVITTHIVCTGTQAIYAKQDTGTDVNIAIYGIQEQIA